jgi:hypothetical protein
MEQTFYRSSSFTYHQEEAWWIVSTLADSWSAIGMVIQRSLEGTFVAVSRFWAVDICQVCGSSLRALHYSHVILNHLRQTYKMRTSFLKLFLVCKCFPEFETKTWYLLCTLQLADTTPPPLLWWCRLIHGISTCNPAHIIVSVFYILKYISNY